MAEPKDIMKQPGNRAEMAESGPRGIIPGSADAAECWLSQAMHGEVYNPVVLAAATVS